MPKHYHVPPKGRTTEPRVSQTIASTSVRRSAPGSTLVSELLLNHPYLPYTYPHRSTTMAPKKPMKDLKKGVSSKKASNIKGGQKKKASSR